MVHSALTLLRHFMRRRTVSPSRPDEDVREVV